MPDEDLHQEQMEQHGPLAVVSNLCVGPNRQPVRHAQKTEAHNASDSGWVLHCGTETQEYTDEPNNYSLVPLKIMIADDASLAILNDLAVGAELTRKGPSDPWYRIIDNKVVDEKGQVIAIVK